MPAPAASFEEIRSVTRSFPAEDMSIHDEVRSRLGMIAGSAGEAGSLGRLAFWLAAAQRRTSPRIVHPRIALFAATHGIAADVPDGSPQALADQVAALVQGGGVLNRLAEAADTDLRLYEMALDRLSGDSRVGPAMDETGAAHAVAYGMMAVEPGIDILMISGLGIGAALAADALGRALATGNDLALGLADPLALLANYGGADIAAMLGTILAARLAAVPVILDGIAALTAGVLAARLCPGGADHCAAATDFSQIPFLRDDLPIESILKSDIASPLAGVTALSLVKAAEALLA